VSESRDVLLWRVRQVALRTDLRIALAKDEPLGDSMRRCAESLVEHLPVTLAAFWLIDRDGRDLELVAWGRAEPASPPSRPRPPISRPDPAVAALPPEGLPTRMSLDGGGLATIVRELHATTTNDVLVDSDIVDRAWAARERLTSFAGFPLMTSDSAVGAMALFGREPMGGEALELMAWVADLITVAIESRRAGEALRQAVVVREAEAARRERAQQHIALQHRVAELLATSSTMNEAMSALLEVLTRALGGDLGVYWRANGRTTVAAWYSGDPVLRDFAATMERGTGEMSEVVGQVVAARAPVCVSRVEPLDGIRSLVAFPVTVDGAVVGVYEFYSRRLQQPEDDLLDVLTTIGRQIGELIRRRQVEEQLIQSQKMEAVGKLAGGVAHDFNNILTVITGYAAMALEQVAPEASLYDHLGEILSASERAGSLVNQLLAFSRKQVFHPRVIDVNTVITDMERMLRRLIGEDIRLVTRRPEMPSMVRADLVHLEQVIVNLAVNARDAMPQGGRLYIEVTHVDAEDGHAPGKDRAESRAHVRILVRDTGVGMAAEVRKRAFDPFFTTKEPGKGTGLGLATVYGIVRQNGGQIRVESEPGKGAQFVILIPRIIEQAAAVAARPSRPAHPGGTETILLVEDEKPVRRLARNILKNAGYDVVEAGSGAEALQVCRKLDRPLHLLLTDVVMPGMNGVELARQLDGHCKDVKVLYMSGYAEDALFEGYAMDRGVAFLEKPFTPATLSAKVRQVLDAARPDHDPTASVAASCEAKPAAGLSRPA
jgi:two-component system cell cycle sensor histidine kinase/response regulator CckA